MSATQRWYYADSEQTFGPIDSREVGELIELGVISRDTWVTPESVEDWTHANASVFATHFAVLTGADFTAAELPREGGETVPPIQEVEENRDPARFSAPGTSDDNRVQPTSSALVGWQFVIRSQLLLSVLAFGLLISGGVLWSKFHRRAGAPLQVQIPGARTTTSVESPLITDSTGTSELPPPVPSLVVKGLYIGMDAEEAAKSIIAQGDGRITVGPTTYRNVVGYDILFPLLGQRVGTRHGQIWIDRSSRKVTTFFFDGHLSDFLFNTADQTAKEFAQTFIDAYRIPTIKPTEFSHMQGWVYDSPEGWTLRIMIDKTVDVSITPDRKFN